MEVIQDRWGEKTTIKDLGPDVLDHVPDQNPGKMMMDPHSPNWMMS